MIRRVLAALDAVVFPNGVQCLCCARASRGEVLCRLCRAQLEASLAPETETASVWWHEGTAAQLVHLLKYEGIVTAEVLAAAMADKLGDVPEDLTVTWVPASEKRMRERGVDHGRMLAEALAQRIHRRAAPLLIRTGERHTQQGLDRAQRLTNVQGAFAAVGGASARVLLVDDVLTTGATARECARVLAAVGAQQVRVITATRARPTSEGSMDE